MSITTGFEDRVAQGVTDPDNTTLAEESTFLSLLETTYDRVSVEVIGSSVNNNDIRKVVVAHPQPVGPQDRPCIYIIAQQHGWETAGREGSFWMMRFLAETQDAQIIEHLSNVQWVFLPTANPDNLRVSDDGGRLNSNGVDLNRDHLALTQPETQAIWSVIHDYDPDVILDLHEARNTAPETDIEFAVPVGVEIPQKLRNEAINLVENYVKPALIGLSYVVGDYEPIIRVSAFTNMVEKNYAVSLLVETEREDDVNVPPRIDRATMHFETLKAVQTFYSNKASALVSIKYSEINEKIKEGRGQLKPLSISDTVTLDPPPAGYTVSSAQWDSLIYERNLVKLRALDTGSSIFISMSRRGKLRTPFVIDTDSYDNILNATRIATAPIINDVSVVGKVGLSKVSIVSGWVDRQTILVSKILE